MNPILARSRVIGISHGEAKPFVERWHYSRLFPTANVFLYGLLIRNPRPGVKEEMYAVADYGVGVAPKQAEFLARVTGMGVTKGNLTELKRLCRVEPALDLPLTAFLSRCHKLLKAEGVRFVVSFSDPAQGHDGGIYKAANFRWLGKTNAETHVVDPEGVLRHRRYYYRYARRKGISVEEARDELGLKKFRTVPKDRWFLPL